MLYYEEILVGVVRIIINIKYSEFEFMASSNISVTEIPPIQIKHIINISAKSLISSIGLYLSLSAYLIKFVYLRSGILMVPVPLSLKVPAFGLAAPFGRPKVFPIPLLV